MQKKYIIYIVTTVMIAALLVVSNQKETPEKNLEIIETAYEKLINPIAEVEYIKITEKNGYYEEIYSDSKTGIQQTDEYTKNNELKIRNIFDGKGGKSIHISKENGKYEGYIETLDPQIVEENLALPNESLIKGMHDYRAKDYLKGEFKLDKSGDNSTFKYVSDLANVYINKDSGAISKIEMTNSKSDIKSIEYDKLKKGEKDLFKIDSPNHSNVDLSKVKLEKHIQEYDDNIKSFG